MNLVTLSKSVTNQEESILKTTRLNIETLNSQKKYNNKESKEVPLKSLEQPNKDDTKAMVIQEGLDWSRKRLGESSSDEQQVNMAIVTKVDQDDVGDLKNKNVMTEESNSDSKYSSDDKKDVFSCMA